jgi:hypothetical protein
MSSEQTSDSGWQMPNAALSRELWYWSLEEGKMMPYCTSTPMSEEEKRLIDPLQEPGTFDTMQGNSTILGSGYRAPGEDRTSYENKDMTLEKGLEGEGAGLFTGEKEVAKDDTGMSMADEVEMAGQALKNIMADIFRTGSPREQREAQDIIASVWGRQEEP